MNVHGAPCLVREMSIFNVCLNYCARFHNDEPQVDDSVLGGTTK